MKLVNLFIALFFCSTLLAQIDRQAAFHFNEAILHFKEKDYSAAVDAYTEAIKIAPNYEKALYNRGKAQLKLKKYKSALGDFQKTVQLNPKHDKALLYSGICFMKAKNYPAAISHFNKSLKIEKSSYALTCLLYTSPSPRDS